MDFRGGNCDCWQLHHTGGHSSRAVATSRPRGYEMSLFSSRLLALSALWSTLWSSGVIADAPLNDPTFVGCFSSSTPLSKNSVYNYQSSGHCWGVCSAINKPVLGLSDGDECWCGDELPAANSKVAGSLCSTPCNGYDLEDCTLSCWQPDTIS